MYCGSLERIDFGEEKESKGFVVADVRRGHAEWQFHKVAARPFVSIRADVRDEADPLAALLDTIAGHKVTDAVVRVLVGARPEQEGMLRDADVRQALEEAYYIASISIEIERAYRQRLDGRWGIVDVDDCVNCARYLIKRGEVDKKRTAIRGGSAGGYTTLAALTFGDVC